jgi:hypothetical protein
VSVVVAVEFEKVAVGLTGVAVVAPDNGFHRFLKMRKMRNPVLGTILSALHGVTQ